MQNNLGHIKFGVICGGTVLYAWQKATLNMLVSELDIELKLVIFDGTQMRKEHETSESSSLWNLYFERRLKKKSAGLQLKECKNLFEGIEKIQCDIKVNDKGQGHLFDECFEKIEDRGLDFIINFSTLSIPVTLVDIPKYGIWQYQFGNTEKCMNSTPGFWEIYQNDVVTSAYLFRLTQESNKMKLLHQGHLKTSISHSKNIDKMWQECRFWPLKICEDIRNENAKNKDLTNTIEVKEIGRSPSNLQCLLFPLIQFNHLVKKVWKQLFFTDYWNVGIVHSPIQEFLNPIKKHTVKWFPALPKTRFMADPFGMYFKDQLHIIYEDLKFVEGIGKTASFLFEDGSFKNNEIVIDEEFHMSYPFLFEKDGEIYCVPETYQANQVRLYKALEFPNEWTLEKVLIENYAGIDNTLFKHQGSWFLFSTDKNSGPHYNLNIHFADDVFGPWEAHPKNPVKTDIRSARPAGTLFEDNGEIFRPSMDYSEKIEGRITVNKVTQLTRLSFEEKAHRVIHPFENTYFSDKVHTLSKIGSYTLVDGAKELFIFSNFYAFKYKMKRVLNKVKNK